MTERVLFFSLEIPIRRGDVDAMGHVSNTVYFRCMDQAFETTPFAVVALTGSNRVAASCEAGRG